MADPTKKAKPEFDNKKHVGFSEQNNNKDAETETNRDKKIKYVLESMMSDADLEKKTDISKKQVKSLTKGLMFADVYDIPLVRNTAIKLMQLSISKGRAGRKELMEVGKTYGEAEEQGGLSKLLTGVE